LEGRTIGNARWRRRDRVVISTASAAALLFVAGEIAAADDTTTGARSPTAQAASTGGSSGSSGSSSRRLKLESEDATPRKAFFYGKRKATYRYSIAGTRPRDLTIQVVKRKTWRVARTWSRPNVEPGVKHLVRWSGAVKGGRPASPGRYLFRVRSDGATAERARSKRDDRTVQAYPYKFPVRGRHTYGDGYGAPRAGHRHQGQDVLASCGLKVAAARGGRVQYSAYQASGAGYYLVIDGKGTDHDDVYMHLRRRGRPKQGGRVRTGQRIGFVGQTGDASGCHLHFEMWTGPGWYEGGRPMRSVSARLKRWDRWS
jgi:murein DD-endopeptidase MepM/ murein hydrolase activator NlpD